MFFIFLPCANWDQGMKELASIMSSWKAQDQRQTPLYILPHFNLIIPKVIQGERDCLSNAEK